MPMEKISIQSDISDLVVLERYVDSVCDQMNVHNYAATLSMSLMAAVKKAISSTSDSPDNNMIDIVCDHCRGGICFTVTGPGYPFASLGNDLSTLLLSSEQPMEQDADFFLMKSLSDYTEVLEEGRGVRLIYLINGIRTSKALERQMVLKKFFVSKMVRV